MIYLCLLALMLALANDQIISRVDGSGSFVFVNKCNYTIWPVISSTGTSGPLSTTGFVLEQGGSKIIQAVYSWGGRFWGRTQCSQDSTGKFTCLTGDCGSGKIECNGGRGNGSVPVTVVEFKLGGFGGLDFYDVSLNDGYNLPLLVVPQGGSGASCLTTGCAADLNNGGACPSELKLTNAQGDVIGCQSPCTVFDTDEYCCRGAYSNRDPILFSFWESGWGQQEVQIWPRLKSCGKLGDSNPSIHSHSNRNTCKASTYSKVFKNACPRAQSYFFDDTTSTFVCAGSPDYIITFCPPSAISPNPSPGRDGDNNIRSNYSYYLPFVNGTVGYDGPVDVNSGSGATTCTHVFRFQLIAAVVAVATTMWRLCQNF